jgi:hypothetical protein
MLFAGDWSVIRILHGDADDRREEVSSASLAVNVNESLPKYPAAGV